MLRKILLDGEEVKSLTTESLPLLIHGKEGSGASLYTLCLAAKWFMQGNKILFLCGYEMAEQEFAKQVGREYGQARFFRKESYAEFREALSKSTSNEAIVFVKNIELFDSRILKALNGRKDIIISGDIDKVKFKGELLTKEFSTRVYFSSLEGDVRPRLEKYQGYLVSKNKRGIASLQ